MTEKKESKALVPSDVGFMAPPREGERVLTKFERMQLQNAKEQLAEIVAGQALQEELIDLALQSTDESDWDDMGARRAQINGEWGPVPYSGQPRLNAKGAKKVRRIAMLRVETFGSQIAEEKEDEHGRLEYFAYVCNGRVTSPWGPPMDCEGRCDSDNRFHSTRYEWNPETKKKERKKLPAYQVNRVNIAQQAQTACVTRGITQYLSLEKLTWEKVLKATSVDPNAAPQTAASFGQPQDKPDTPPPPDDPPPPSEADAPQAKPSIQQITAVKRMAKDAGVARDPVSWWEFVASTAGADYGISEQQDENAAYACWTSDVVEKLKAEIVKRRQDQG